MRGIGQRYLIFDCRFQWPSGLSVSLETLACWGCGFESRAGAWMYVCYECCVSSGRGLYDGLITRPEESYQLWCVCDGKASILSKSWPTRGCCDMKKIS